MTTIVCATRGGEASVHTQMQAIELAKIRDSDILFVYVADVNFTEDISGSIVLDVAAEMENMGEFLLQKAKKRAEKEGVTAQTVIKHGEFQAALLEAARESGASAVVLGSPGEDSSITQREYLEKLSASLAEEAGLETLIV
ncbi:MAG: universal stress protein [Anaerolineae bacterium]|nr:universal stress protein [Anaerolineae bacterium]